MHLGQIVAGKWRAAPDFGDAVRSPAEQLRPGNSSWWILGREGWLDAALFLCFILFVLCAPIATKGAVTAFRTALLLWLVKILIEKGVLPPSAAQVVPTQPESAKPASDEGKPRHAQFTGILDCRLPSTYRAFGVLEGGKPAAEDPNVRSVKPE